MKKKSNFKVRDNSLYNVLSWDSPLILQIRRNLQDRCGIKISTRTDLRKTKKPRKTNNRRLRIPRQLTSGISERDNWWWFATCFAMYAGDETMRYRRFSWQKIRAARTLRRRSLENDNIRVRNKSQRGVCGDVDCWRGIAVKHRALKKRARISDWRWEALQRRASVFTFEHRVFERTVQFRSWNLRTFSHDDSCVLPDGKYRTRKIQRSRSRTNEMKRVKRDAQDLALCAIVHFRCVDNRPISRENLAPNKRILKWDRSGIRAEVVKPDAQDLPLCATVHS